MTGVQRREMEKSWATRCAERRAHLGLTQRQLAALCKPPVTQQTISKFENNEIVPRISTLEAIAAAMATTVEVLFPWPSRPRKAS